VAFTRILRRTSSSDGDSVLRQICEIVIGYFFEMLESSKASKCVKWDLPDHLDNAGMGVRQQAAIAQY
jgi:hypothetical protein